MGNTVKNNGYLMSYRQTQQGVVLAVALIMLVLITLLATSAMRSTTMEERMAGNSRNINIAFQLAETTLRQVETLLETDADSRSIIKATDKEVLNSPPSSCEVDLDEQDFAVQSGWDLLACDYVGTADDGITRTPHYFIEFVHADADLAASNPPRGCIYRITARGYGPDANSAVTLQTTYRFDSCTNSG